MGHVDHVGCYSHVNNIHCAVIMIFIMKVIMEIKRDREKGMYTDKLVKEGKNQYFDKISLINDKSPLTLPLLNIANALKRNILCTFALLVTTILFYAIQIFLCLLLQFQLC